MWNKLPNGGIEREIKRYLKKKGYRDGSYELKGTELIAIARPGWEQIFQFLLVTKDDDGEHKFAKGIAYDDHRKGCRICITTSEREFQTLLAEWGEGMIHRRISRHEFNPFGLLRFLVISLSVLFLVALIWNHFERIS
ncbi:hypothetical protein [uncultured Rubinisphaera sp.]|mgnify:CR=1 FL=1|uniref:hypothetical protein n=1 Tax=uncultured Rubinisphaera sp. TaxID=1678686 RepID=UPI0030DD3FD5|tara:strand:- start:778 stop:1191 length:414 start_codon:yes stop_codon:yes gene_type:complete